jgi:hypothetical protein
VEKQMRVQKTTLTKKFKYFCTLHARFCTRKPVGLLSRVHIARMPWRSEHFTLPDSTRLSTCSYYQWNTFQWLQYHWLVTRQRPMHCRAHIEPFQFHRVQYSMRHIDHIVTYITVALCLSCGKQMVVCKMWVTLQRMTLNLIVFKDSDRTAQ